MYNGVGTVLVKQNLVKKYQFTGLSLSSSIFLLLSHLDWQKQLIHLHR